MSAFSALFDLRFLGAGFSSSTSSLVVQYNVRSLTILSGFCNFAASNVMYSSPSNLCLNFNPIMQFAINSYVKVAITFLFTTCFSGKYLKPAYKELSHISSKSVYQQHRESGWLLPEESFCFVQNSYPYRISHGAQ